MEAELKCILALFFLIHLTFFSWTFVKPVCLKRLGTKISLINSIFQEYSKVSWYYQWWSFWDSKRCCFFWLVFSLNIRLKGRVRHIHTQILNLLVDFSNDYISGVGLGTYKSTWVSQLLESGVCLPEHAWAGSWAPIRTQALWHGTTGC